MTFLLSTGIFQSISYVIAGIIIFTAIYLAIKTDIIKDPTQSTSVTSEKTYSFARTQLMWWTVIISCLYIIRFGLNESFTLENMTVVALLGIGVVTTAGGSIIDTNQAQASITRHQDGGGKGFIHDLLSDGHGISMHRFQALIFNVLFGIVFIVYFFDGHNTFPEFDTEQLSLLGISSGTYLALKTNENKVPTKQVDSP